jgi:hypothetical protein
LVGAALSVGVFYGCQKESFSSTLQESLQGQNESKIDPKYKAPSVSEAQNWFEQSYGKTHTITKTGDTSQGSVLNVRSGSLKIDVTPVWSDAQISAYLSNRQVLMVPVNPIVALKKRGFGYCAVFFRDSVGKIDYTLQVAAAKPTYLATHENLSVNDFTGAFLQIRPDGEIKNTLSIKDGKIVSSLNLTKTSQANFDGRSWEDVVNSWLDQLVVFLENSGGGFNTHDPFSGVNYGDIGVDPVASTTGGGPLYYPPIVLNTEIDNTLFDVAGQTIKFAYYQGIYMKMGFNDTEFEIMHNNKKLFTQVHRALSLTDVNTINSNNFIDKFWNNLVLDEGLSNLNAQERQLAKDNKIEFLIYGTSAQRAIAETRIRFGQNIEVGNDRNRVNAFQHALWNAYMTWDLGRDRTKVWADAHESGLANNQDNNFATQMDFFNNEVGRRIGAELSTPNVSNLQEIVNTNLDNGMMRYVCFDMFNNNNPVGQQYINQRFRFTNQTCP